MTGVDAIENAKKHHKKGKTVVFQPFGRTSEMHKGTGHVIDPSSRSLSTNDYFYISEKKGRPMGRRMGRRMGDL